MTYLIDLDNTLIDENEYLFQAYEEIARKNNFDVNIMIEIFMNEGRDYLFDKMIARFGGKLKDYLYTLRTVKLLDKLEVYPVMVNLLNKIIKKKERIFVVTNGNQIQQINKVRQTDWNGLDKHITFIYADMIYPKPDRRLFNWLRDKYIIRDAIMVGDSKIDHKFAINSSIQFIQIKN